MTIKQNKIQCTHCNDIIESTHVHDFKYCSCKKVAVDGGKEYLRRLYHTMTDYLELSKWENNEEKSL